MGLGGGSAGQRRPGHPITKAALGQGGGRARRSWSGVLTEPPLKLFSVSKYLTTAQRRDPSLAGSMSPEARGPEEGGVAGGPEEGGLAGVFWRNGRNKAD